MGRAVANRLKDPSNDVIIDVRGAASDGNPLYGRAIVNIYQARLGRGSTVQTDVDLYNNLNLSGTAIGKGIVTYKISTAGDAVTVSFQGKAYSALVLVTFMGVVTKTAQNGQVSGGTVFLPIAQEGRAVVNFDQYGNPISPFGGYTPEGKVITNVIEPLTGRAIVNYTGDTTVTQAGRAVSNFDEYGNPLNPFGPFSGYTPEGKVITNATQARMSGPTGPNTMLGRGLLNAIGGPPKAPPMPKVVGLDINSAKTLLAAYSVQYMTTPTLDPNMIDIIYAQEPSPGNTVAYDMPITLWYYTPSFLGGRAVSNEPVNGSNAVYKSDGCYGERCEAYYVMNGITYRYTGYKDRNCQCHWYERQVVQS